MNISRAAIDAILTLWMLALTAIVYYFYRTKRRIFTMAGNYASILGKKSGEVRHEQASSKHLASGQAKVIDTLSSQVPGLSGILKSSGVSNGEAWALATDPNTLKGLKVIFDTLGGAAKFFTDKAEGQPRKRKDKRSTQGAPLKELKHG